MIDRLNLIRDFGIKAIGKLFNKEYIPNPKEHLYIETSNICNLGCRICPYRKISNKKQVMSYELFTDIINKAAGFGYEKFGLTPLTGEVLTDKGFIGKLNYLESHPKVKEYSFYSNFTLASDEIIDSLVSFKKLNTLSISLYGHDSKSFELFTGANPKVFDNLLYNLNYLLSKLPSAGFKIEFGLRTSDGFDFDSCRNELCAVVKKIIGKSGAFINVNESFNNWGGYITQADVEGLNIKINENAKILKKGACSLIFYKNIVLSDGRVNACACRDVEATMCIGDLTKQQFSDIYSDKNLKYMELISNQNKGKFSEVCANCDFYRSVNKYYSVYKTHTKHPVTLKDFMKSLKQ